MKTLSKTSKQLFATIGIIGITSAAFATTQLNTKKSENESLAASQAKVTLTQAMDIAKQKAQGDIIGAKFESKKGGIYEVEFADANASQEVKINATTGAIIKVKQEKLEKDDIAEFSALRQAKVTLTQAMQNASQTMNGQVIGGEFSNEKGTPLYEVEVFKDSQVYDVTIDANSGAVLSQKLDVADDENDEDGEQNKAHEKAQNVQRLTQVVNSVQSA